MRPDRPRTAVHHPRLTHRREARRARLVLSFASGAREAIAREAPTANVSLETIQTSPTNTTGSGGHYFTNNQRRGVGMGLGGWGGFLAMAHSHNGKTFTMQWAMGTLSL